MRGPDPAAAQRPRLRTGPTLVVALLPLLAACGVGLGEEPRPDQSAVLAPSELPVPISSGPRVAASGTLNVLTGEPAPDGRVLAVAVDDTAAARPQAGLDQADVVYVADVGGGVTGLLALFQTEVPSRVGPLRPAGPGDVPVLAGLGPVALGATSADPDVVEQLSPVGLQLVLPDAGSEGFVLDPARDGTPDVVADGSALLGRAPGSGVAQDVGLRFGPPHEDGSPTASGSYAWSDSTVEFEWSGADEAWVRQLGGEAVVDEAGEPVRADNVLFVAARTDLTGTGPVTLLRDGTAVVGSWSREVATDPTSLADAAGEELRLDVGSTWVVLIPEGESPTLTDG